MSNLKEIFEKARQTGQVEYTYFSGGTFGGATYIAPFTQTSIPFGNDTDYGAGSSRQPYIKLGYDPNTKFITNDPTNTINKGLSIVRDTERITKFFLDFPNGPLWLSKQVTLQRTNPDVSYKNAEGTSTVIDQLQGPRFYNPLGTNTLASVAGTGLGLHFTRHGLSPVDETGYISLNTSVDGQFQSRLDIYKNKLVENETTLNKYSSGPSSFFGLGSTSTTAYKDSYGLNTGVTNKGNIEPNTPLSNLYLGFLPWSYDNIEVYGTTETKNLSVPNVDKNLARFPLDFRGEKANPNTSNYPTYNVHNRIGVTSNQNSIGNPNTTVDSINVISITPRATFYDNSNSAKNPTSKVTSNLIYSGLYDTAEVQSKTGGNFGRDIIKFRIELLNNDDPLINGALNTDVLAFRAYLNTLTDDINPTWKSFNYMGRGEEFFTYEKFSRKINFSFTVFAHSEYEMPAIYTKLNYLMSSMAPDYNDKLQMRGTYAYLTIGDYVYQQPGVFTSMQISNLLDSPWEIALQEPENRGTNSKDAKQHEVPKYLRVNMAFSPIHNFLPKKNKRNKPHTATFITPNWELGHPNRYLPQDPNGLDRVINVSDTRGSTNEASVLTSPNFPTGDELFLNQGLAGQRDFNNRLISSGNPLSRGRPQSRVILPGTTNTNIGGF